MTTWIPRHLLYAWFLALGLVLAACGDDTSETDLFTDVSDAGQDETTDTVSEPEVTVWEAALFRFDEFNITRPTGIGPILNGLINLEIRRDRLHILLETYDFGAETGATTFKLRASSGVHNIDDTFSFTELPVPFDAEVDAEGNFHNTSPGTLPIPVTFYIDPDCDDGPCPDNACRTDDDCDEGFHCLDDPDGQCEKVVTIPLNELTVEGTFGVGATGNQDLPGIRLNGVIFKSDADTIVFDLGANLVTLTQVLGEDAMDYPEEGTRTGWWMSAQVNAYEVEPAPVSE